MATVHQQFYIYHYYDRSCCNSPTCFSLVLTQSKKRLRNMEFYNRNSSLKTLNNKGLLYNYIHTMIKLLHFSIKYFFKAIKSDYQSFIQERTFIFFLETFCFFFSRVPSLRFVILVRATKSSRVA